MPPFFDLTLKTFAERAGIRLVTVADLNLPEESKQGALDFSAPVETQQ